MSHPAIPRLSVLSLFRVSALIVGFAAVVLHAAPADDLRGLTGAHTRVVWLQDAGETAAVDSERPTLRLMGLDTEDGQGERALLPALARYGKPLFTADGTRVLYGDRGDNTVHIVNWDGTGHRRVLENAYFEDVWTDPRDGVEWIYARVTEKRGDKDIPVIRRFRLDRPEVSELIWDKMPVFMFTVSGDGRAASGGGDGGNSPQGLLTLPNGTFTARAGGCWPSIAPDASHRMWVFTGNHRSAHMFFPTNRTGNAYGQTVLFHPVPGLKLVGQEEVHRIRWSNDTRFLVVSGPFVEWAYRAEVKIPNHVAEKIEVYVGKFSDDLKTVERWVPVTANKRGDYWADVWVKQTPEALQALRDSVMASSAQPYEAPAAPDQKGMVYLWETGAAGNQITDEATGAIRQCIGQFRDEARYARYHAMDLAGGAFVPEAADAPLLAGAKASNQFAFEGLLTPPSTPPAGEGVIVAFADDFETGNLALTQKGDWLTLRLKTGDAKTLSPAIPLVRLVPGRANHVIVSYADGELACYLDGQRVLLANPLRGGLAGWTPQPLIFGDTWKGGRNWPGLLEGVGVFTRTIGAAEARQRFNRQTERIAGRAQAARVVVEAKLIATCPPADPAGIAPYRRCLSLQQFEVLKVVEGECADKKISVAQWSVLDAKVFPEYLTYKKGQTYRIALERWSDRPEQESERMLLGDFEEEGEMFYQVRETPATTAAPTAPVTSGAKGDDILVRGEAKPLTLVAEAGATLDLAGRDLTFENGSLTEIAVKGNVRLGGGGRVTAATVVSGGFGYTESLRVMFSGGGGHGASGVATMGVSRLGLARLGSGYTSEPTVVIAPPDVVGGRQAAATAQIDKAGGTIASLRITDAGTGYLRSPRVTLTGGGGEGVEVEPTMEVEGVFITSGGTGYKTPPVLTLEGGGGEGAVAMAALQRTTLRYGDAGGHALIVNEGTLDQDGAALIYDWAASANNTGKRGFTNSGSWTLRNGAVIHTMSSTNRPLWGLSLVNEGTMRVLDGSRIGGSNFRNTGNLELGAGAIIGQLEYARGDGTLTNLGLMQISGPAAFGVAHPERNGKRQIENGAADASAKASFTLGDGAAPASFAVTGGQVVFTNHPGAVLKIQAGSALALRTDDAGSRNRFENREARLLNAGDLLLAGRFVARGNHAGFVGIENRGRLAISGDTASLERLMASTGPGGYYKPGVNDAQILNAPGGLLFGAGTLSYVNSTESADASGMRLVNLGTLTAGINAPGLLTLRNVNVHIGVAATDKTPAQPGQLQIEIAGPPSALEKFDRFVLTGDAPNGKFEIAKGVGSVLDIVPLGNAVPRGKYRIVTALAVTGEFDGLRLSGAPSTAYTVNYLPDGIEVVFP